MVVSRLSRPCLLVILFLLCLQLGCGVTFWYAKPPPVPPSADPVQNCIAANQIVVRPARAGAGNLQNSLEFLRKFRPNRQGLTFYRGGARLTPDQALALLSEPALRQRYLAQVDVHQLRAEQYFGGGVALTVVGFLAATAGGIMLIMGLYSLGDEDDTKWKTYLGAGIASLLASGGMTATGGVLIYRARKRRDEATVRRNIFVAPELQPALTSAIQRYNHHIAARCARLASPPPAPASPSPSGGSPGPAPESSPPLEKSPGPAPAPPRPAP